MKLLEMSLLPMRPGMGVRVNRKHEPPQGGQRSYC